MSWLSKSSIGRKFVQSVSGLFLVLFLLFHMSMNIALVFSYDAYDFIANEMLGANWWAIIGTALIVLAFAVHIWYAIVLTLQNKKARGSDMYASANKTQTSWSSKNMFVLGLVIFLFLVLHFIQFWYQMQFKEFLGMEGAREDAAHLVEEVFKNPIYVIIYLIAFAALWFHLTHGFWSALQTLGTNNKKWYGRLKCIGIIYATILALGFSIVAVYFFFGPFGACCAA